MSVAIKYPFPQYAKLLHNLGLKFVESERGWIGYELNKKVLETKVPDDVKEWVSEFFSFHDALKRLKAKVNTVIDKSVEDAKFVAWRELTEEESLSACYRAQAESEARKELLLHIKMDFSHPKVRLTQGGGTSLWKENGIVYIQGSMHTYHREGLNTLFQALSRFITMSENRVKSGDFNLPWSKEPTNFQGSLHELKVLALTETLSDYYQIKRANRKQALEVIADLPDSELFFNAHMHLVSKFVSETKEDEREDKIAYKWFTQKEGLSEEEARRQVNYISSQILQRRHKAQVLAEFYAAKLSDKYTMEHVKFMFQQQLPFLD
jgi:hypothetical protein